MKMTGFLDESYCTSLLFIIVRTENINSNRIHRHWLVKNIWKFQQKCKYAMNTETSTLIEKRFWKIKFWSYNSIVIIFVKEKGMLLQKSLSLQELLWWILVLQKREANGNNDTEVKTTTKVGRILRWMLERPNPRRTGIEHFEKIPKVVHRIYLNISEEEAQGQIEILWGKAINNVQQTWKNCSIPILWVSLCKQTIQRGHGISA